MSPVHSIKKNDPNVYHNNRACREWNNIEKENLRPGDAGRPLCKHCADLNREGK